MRRPTGAAVVCFALTLCWAAVGAAAETAPQPEAVPRSEIVAQPEAAPLAAPAPAAGRDDTEWGLLARGGYFGLPDAIADKLFYQHPKVSGWTAGGEWRYHGDGGGRGIASVGIAVDYAKTEGDGIWQVDKYDKPQALGGDISVLAVTVTGYWSLFPSWYLHPYVGIGLGAGYFKGSLQNEDSLTEVSIVLPVLHVPLGLAAEFGKRVQLVAEARFLDGIAAGGGLQVRF